jgi:hypothetical protein
MERSKKKRSKLNYAPPVGAAVLEQLNKHDVVCGRGTKIVSLEGNAHFRLTIHAFKDEYQSSSGLMKRDVAAKVVKHIESLDPPGCFYKILPDETLQTVSFERALAKTMQALREKRGPGALPSFLIQQDCEVPPAVVETSHRSAEKRSFVKKSQAAKPVKRLKIRIKKITKGTQSYPVTSPELVEGLVGNLAARELKTKFDEAMNLDDRMCMIDKTARAVAQGGRLQQLVESALAITTTNETNPSTLDEKFSLVPPALTVFVSGMYSSNTLDNMGSNSSSNNSAPYSPLCGRSAAVFKEKINQKMAGQQQNKLDSTDDDIMDLVDLGLNGQHSGPMFSHDIHPCIRQQQPRDRLGMDILPFVQSPLLQATNSLFLPVDEDDFNDSYYPPVRNLEEAERAPAIVQHSSVVFPPSNIAFSPIGRTCASYYPKSVGKIPSVIAHIYTQANWSNALLDCSPPGTVMDVVEPPELHCAKQAALFPDEQDDRQDNADIAESIDMSIFQDIFSTNSLHGI